MSTLSRRDLLKWSGAAGLLLTSPALLRGEDKAALATPVGPSGLAGFYPFKIGSWDAIALHDGTATIPKVQPLFAPEGSAEEVNKALTDAFQPTDSLTIQFNVLLVKTGSETLLVDTGYGAGSGPTTGKLLENLAAAGVKPESITGILFSHGHGDHFGGFLDKTTKAPVFPNARIFVNKAEQQFWTGDGPLQFKERIGEDARKNAADTFAALKPKLELIAPGDKILDGIEAIDAHGHTPGHLNFLFSNGSDQLLHIVDTAHNAVLMFGHPEWTVAFDVDNQQSPVTRRKIFARAAAERLRVFAYHLPWPGLGHIRAAGPGYEWVAEPWQWPA